MYSKAGNIGVILVAIVLVLAIIFLSVSLFRTMRKMEEKFSSASGEINAAVQYNADFAMLPEIKFYYTDEKGFYPTFLCHVSSELYEEVYNDPNKSFVTLVSFVHEFEKVKSAESTDWITLFDAAEDVRYGVFNNTPSKAEEGEGWLLKSGLVDLTDYTYRITAISAIKTVEGDSVTYQYASMPLKMDYSSFSTSMVYESTKLLNKVKFGIDGITITDNMDSRARSIINSVVDTAKGESVTDNNSTFACTLPETLTMYVGDAMYLPITVSPADIPVSIYYHGNGDIASVERWTGKVTAKSPGTYLVAAYIGGEASNVCTITIVE